ncbi:hypothetical protein LPTSP3_g04890 [Leptospira kobayashii]|uniref:Uncharacterized protein n=1 Tax=Leptospira kobayashii TaxID=1917830 RepID=A0ABN6KBC7_9LEPT|nr:hypothetical protein LPTSP3_g04890 [Leptospira kobayashii]
MFKRFNFGFCVEEEVCLRARSNKELSVNGSPGFANSNLQEEQTKQINVKKEKLETS